MPDAGAVFLERLDLGVDQPAGILAGREAVNRLDLAEQTPELTLLFLANRASELEKQHAIFRKRRLEPVRDIGIKGFIDRNTTDPGADRWSDS